jgi:hypothetical protein
MHNVNIVTEENGRGGFADLAGVVLWVMLHRLDLPGHGRNVKHSSRPSLGLLRRFLKQRQEAGRHEVDLRNVRPIHIIPVLECSVLSREHVLLHLLGAGRFGLESLCGYSGVVDQDIQVGFLLGDLIVELRDVILFGNVGCNGDDLAGDVLAVGLDYGF